MHRDVHLV
jgi:hypothetical protein